MFFLPLIFENSSVCLGDLVFSGQFGVSGSPLLLFFFFFSVFRFLEKIWLNEK